MGHGTIHSPGHRLPVLESDMIPSGDRQLQDTGLGILAKREYVNFSGFLEAHLWLSSLILDLRDINLSNHVLLDNLQKIIFGGLKSQTKDQPQVR